MQQLVQHTLNSLHGEHFLRVEAAETMGSVFDRLRDHRCAAAVFLDNDQWRVVSARQLPAVLLEGALGDTVSQHSEALDFASGDEVAERLPARLEEHGWVAVLHGDAPGLLLNWISYARFLAQESLAAPFTFSPEWER